jgi:hypothetical protein
VFLIKNARQETVMTILAHFSGPLHFQLHSSEEQNIDQITRRPPEVQDAVVVAKTIDK